MNHNMSLSEMVTYSTVLIQCEYADNTSGSGTGFIINLCNDKETNKCIPVLITNNHVVENSKKTVFEFCRADKKGNPIDVESFSFICKINNWIHHPDCNIDLCCLPLGPAFNEMQNGGIKIFYIPLETSMIPTKNVLNELSAMEDVTMVGYPIGLSDTYNHKPIMRRGITASHPKKDYKGESEILVDMACFPGSSGSPVFILNEGAFTTSNGIMPGNRIILLGILYGGPQFNAQGVLTFANLPNAPRPVINIPTNLGMIIKAEKILEFENIFI